MPRLYFFTLIFFIISFKVAAQDKFISVGSGGGFAGTATVFKITPKGEVFKGSGIGDIKYTLCGKIQKAKAKQMITRVADLVRSKTSFNHPGNLFYFVSYTEDKNAQTVTWGDSDHPIQEDVKKLYEEVLASVNSVSFRPIK